MPTIQIEGRGSYEVVEGTKLVLALEDNGVDILHRCGATPNARRAGSKCWMETPVRLEKRKPLFCRPKALRNRTSAYRAKFEYITILL